MFVFSGLVRRYNDPAGAGSGITVMHDWSHIQFASRFRKVPILDARRARGLLSGARPIFRVGHGRRGEMRYRSSRGWLKRGKRGMMRRQEVWAALLIALCAHQSLALMICACVSRQESAPVQSCVCDHACPSTGTMHQMLRGSLSQHKGPVLRSPDAQEVRGTSALPVDQNCSHVQLQSDRPAIVASVEVAASLAVTPGIASFIDTSPPLPSRIRPGFSSAPLYLATSCLLI